MRKTVRRFQLQPVVEGLDRRIAPSSMVANPGTPVSTSPTTGQKVTPPNTGGGDTNPTLGGGGGK